MPKNLKPQDVIPILEKGNLDDLIGVVENEGIEAKQEPYQLHQDHNKQELAKDVSGMANSNGGVILLGVRTQRDPAHFGDEITKIRAFPQPMVDINRYHDVLKTWVYPSLQGIEIRWFPSCDDVQNGIAAIIIPKQPKDQRPSLITRTVDQAGKQTKIIFGYVERKRDYVDPMSVQHLHTLIRDGLRFDSLSKRIESIQETLEDIRTERAVENNENAAKRLKDITDDRIKKALSAVELLQEPAYILLAIPKQPVKLPTLFQSKSAEIVRLLENPPELRHAGFDLEIGASAEIIDGKLRRAAQPGYKILELWRDGTLIFIATGSTEYLCWGRRAKENQPLRINQLVLLESTYLFAELSKQIFAQVENRPPGFEYNLRLRNMTIEDSPCLLISGPIGSFPWQFGGDTYEAPDPNFDISVSWDKEEIDSGKVAFRLTSELYLWFGIEYAHIPYTVGQGTELAISPDEIVKAVKR